MTLGSKFLSWVLNNGNYPYPSFIEYWTWHLNIFPDFFCPAKSPLLSPPYQGENGNP
jgi:hypothetical protein